MEISYYVLKVREAEGLPAFLLKKLGDKEKGDLYISPTMRLCGVQSMACVKTRKLADSFSDYCVSMMMNRYQSRVSIEIREKKIIVELLKKREENDLKNRIENDSRFVRFAKESGFVREEVVVYKNRRVLDWIV